MSRQSTHFALPLRHHLAILVAGVLLPMVIFSTIVVWQLARSERAVDERRFGQTASEVADAFDREVDSTFRSLNTLAQSNALQEDDLPAFYQVAARVLKIQPSWTTIILVDGNGKPLINLHQPFGAPLPPISEPESLSEILQMRKPNVGTLKSGREGILAFPIRVPVTDGPRVRYVLTAVITAESLANLVSAHRPLADEWTRTLVDSSGIIAARTRSPQAFVGKPATQTFLTHAQSQLSGFFRNISLEGEPVYVSFTHTRFGNWTASVVTPRAVLEGPTRRLVLLTSTTGLAVLLLTTGAAFLLARRLGHGIATTAQAAERLASGDQPVVYPSRITEVSQLSEALLRSAKLLQQREKERTDLLVEANAARAEAEAANRAKDEFLAMLGHELRNPLGPMRTSVHLLAVLPPGDARLEGLHQTLERQTEHMARIVDDLLDASRIRRQRFEIDRKLVDLSGLVGHVVSDMRPQFEKEGLALLSAAPENPVFVYGDRTRLGQALANLLHNAAKFTPRGGTVRVDLSARDDQAILSISDSGEGIDPAFLPLLFRPFAQGPQRLDRPNGGLGLGLALVRGFVEAHDGTVSGESDGLGRGATFTVTLPATRDRPATAVAAATTTRDSERRRILLIEDMHDAARTLKLLLSLDGHTVEIAHSGNEALSKAPGFRPEVIVCDIGLPDIDGYTLCGMLRKSPALGECLLIALTGYGQSDDIAQALRAGFHLHLTKPVNIDTLRQSVMKSLEAEADTV